jgi:transposase
MANLLTMADIQAILGLHERGWRNRRIARALDVDRETVAKYIRASGCVPKPAKAPVGSEPVSGVLVPAESPPDLAAGMEASAATSLEKECGRSACEPYRQVVLEKLEQGLSGQRIYQDLRGDGFDHEYHSVRRFVAKWRGTRPLPFRRMECEAGEEAQVDFGTGAWIELPDGKRRRSHVFRIVLSYSRKGYSEAVYRQTTEDFIRSMENALWHFGGVPKVLVIDNLKAAVKHPDWYDPELNPKVQSFCEHYGVTILPTKPRTPRHKGKIESGVGYVQDNGLKGHRFLTLEGENEHLAQWETTVAGVRRAPICGIGRPLPTLRRISYKGMNTTGWF